MLKRLRKRIREHVKLFGYRITDEQLEDIATLYSLNHEDYDEHELTLHIENFIKDLNTQEDRQWEKSRRVSVYATRVNVETVELAKYPKSEEESAFLISRLGTELPFCLLSESQKKQLVESMYPMIIEKKVKLIVEGDFGLEMYIVENGEFEVLVRGKVTNKLNSGSVFGELALLHGIPRTATVVAVERSKVWCVEQTSFSYIRIRDQMYCKELTRAAIETSKELMEIVKTRESVDKITENASRRFVSAGSTVEVGENEVLVVLKKAVIVDSEKREVKPKDLLKDTFYAESDMECVFLNLEAFK